MRSAHFAPFQVSTTSGSPPPTWLPIATQLLTDTQDTPLKETSPPPFGAGSAAVGRSAAPFQLSAYGSSLPFSPGVS